MCKVASQIAQKAYHVKRRLIVSFETFLPRKR